MSPAETGGNKLGALSESDLTTPSTWTFEVLSADLMRPPAKRKQRRIVDTKKIRIMQSLNCGDECQGHEQEAFPELGALKWGRKTA